MVLGFTSADGCAVMCAIIIAASKLRVTYVGGFDPLSKDEKDLSDEDVQWLEKEIEEMKDDHSNGDDRIFPLGTTCIFNGIEVPPFITCSKNRSITSLLLTNMLQRMDDLLLFDRNDGINN
jgi:hypothetical protein